MRFLLDTSVFALLNSFSQAEFEDYLFDLQNWEYWQKEPSNEIFVLSSLIDTLSTGLLFPFDYIINDLLHQYGIDFIQGYDVNRIMTRIIDKAKRIDEIAGFPVIDCAHYSFISQDLSGPLAARLSLQESFIKAILSARFYSQIVKSSPDSFCIFAKSSSRNIRVSVSYDVLWDNDIQEDVKEEINVTCYHSLDDFLRDANSSELYWLFATDKYDLECGVKSKLFHDLDLCELSELKDFSFVIQKSFFDDYSKNHYNDSPTVIRAAIRNITETLLDRNMSDVHPIREDSGGNTKDLERNGAKAFRREISKDGKRIHYWKDSRRFSFANISEHDFYSISFES